jgi:pyridoxal biosynthesis lyase PdxS
MALERVPADIRQQGGVARMSDPKMIKDIMDAVSIPVMAKVRIGHFVEAQVCHRCIRMSLIGRSLKQLELTISMRVRC